MQFYVSRRHAGNIKWRTRKYRNGISIDNIFVVVQEGKEDYKFALEINQESRSLRSYYRVWID